MAGPVDVLVVGGRVAGSLTAIRFAATGAAVRLLEAHTLPSDTLSTHFFRGDGLVRSLRDVGVLDEVLAAGSPPLGCEYFALDGAPFEQEPPQEPGEVGFCLSVRRVTLDEILLRRARELGVDVRMRTRVARVVVADQRVTGVVDQGGDTHPSSLVVGADGRRSTIARLVEAPEEERHPAARAMYYRYLSGWPVLDPVGAEFLLDGDRFAYVFPSDAGIACVAVSVTLDEHRRSHGRYARVIDDAVRAHPSTRARMDDATWVSDVFAGLPAAAVWRRGAGPGWALVGDAGASQDPWAGLGMDAAARQAEALVEAVAAADDWGPTYERLRWEQCHPGFAETARLAPDLRQLVA